MHNFCYIAFNVKNGTVWINFNTGCWIIPFLIIWISNIVLLCWDILTVATDVKTDGNGRLVSAAHRCKFPGAEFRRSLRLDPSLLVLEGPPDKRLLKGSKMEGGLDKALNESRANGGLESWFWLSTDLKELLFSGKKGKWNVELANYKMH